MRLSYYLDFLFPKTGGRDIHTYLPAGYFSSTERFLRKMLVTNETLVQEVWVALDYNLHWVRELIHRAKFEGEFAIAEDLAEVLYLNWQAENNGYQPDLVTYVPWDPVRFVQRGYHLPEKNCPKFGQPFKLTLPIPVLEKKNYNFSSRAKCRI
jgi:predicted amidophosphoribosyltransferase